MTGKINAVAEQTKDHGEWLALRSRGIGGSDAGAVLGVNPYSTPLSVYLTKKGKNKFNGNAATRTGAALEEPIRKWVESLLGVTIEKPDVTYIHPSYTWMLANLDGVMDTGAGVELNGVKLEGVGGWECKTSREGLGFGEDSIPPHYFAQVQHYMAVTGLAWFVLTALMLSTGEPKHYVVLRDDAYIQTLVAAEEIFWNDFVKQDKPPQPTGNDNEVQLVNELEVPDKLQLPEARLADLERLEVIKGQIKELETQRKVIEEMLKLDMAAAGGDAKKTTATCGDWVITWNEQTRRSVDTDALKQAGLFDKYSKESASKVLRVTHKAEAKK